MGNNLIDKAAEEYVHLALALGRHDSAYVDAYYGPPEWQTRAKMRSTPLEQIQVRAAAARAMLGDSPPWGSDELETLRWENLGVQLDALQARVAMLGGKQFSFDEESAALYDIVDPGHPDSFYEDALAKLEPLLPGDGSLSARYDRYRANLFVPTERLAAVFDAAIRAARERTKRYIALPEADNFHIEYVSDKVWGAYNWYKGDAFSLIQVNTDFAMPIDRALGLACHEGYPGHHVYNLLLEQHLAKARNWVEFMVYPLYSPQSLIAEGTAEYGVALCFPPEERLEFEREVLYPLAGLDPGLAEGYAAVLGLISDLGYSSNDAARRYLDGKATREETVDWFVRYSLSTPERAEQRVRFIEHNRSYVVTYNVGQDLIQRYIESRATTVDERWKLFAELLSSPRTPSGLARLC